MNSTTCTVDTSLFMGQLHSKDRPSFFIPGITGRARCLSSKSKSESSLSGRSVLIDLVDFRARTLRSSSRSAPESSSPTNQHNVVVLVVDNNMTREIQNYTNNDDINNNDDDNNDGETIEMAQSIHDSVLATIMEKPCIQQCTNYRFNKSDSLLDLFPLSSLTTSHSLPVIDSLDVPRLPRKSSRKTKGTITSLPGPLTPESQKKIHNTMIQSTSATVPKKSMDSDQRIKSKPNPLLSPNPSPTAVAIPHTDFDRQLPSYELRSLECAMSPSQKPRSTTFLPHHLLPTTPTINPCFQPFDADDSLPRSWSVPPPPPLLGGNEWRDHDVSQSKSKSTLQNTVPTSHDESSLTKKEQVAMVHNIVKTNKVKGEKTKKSTKQDTKLKRKSTSKKSSKNSNSTLAIVSH